MYSRHEISRGHTNSPSSRGARDGRQADETVLHGTAPTVQWTEHRANLSRFVFPASGGHSPAWYLRIRLSLAGDIELNPGPDPWRCFKCLRAGRTNHTPLKCPCGATSHRQRSCSGISRYDDYSSWRCPRCVPASSVSTVVGRPLNQNALLPAPTTTAQSSQLITSSTHCLKCDNFISEKIRVLACSSCKRPCHLKCSTLSRTAQRTFVARCTWKCDSCVDSQTRPTSNTILPPSRSKRLLR